MDIKELIDKYLNDLDEKTKQELELFLINSTLSDDKESTEKLFKLLEKIKINYFLK